MCKMIQIELSRAFRNKWMAVSLAIGCTLALAQAAAAYNEAAPGLASILAGAEEWRFVRTRTVFENVLGTYPFLPSIIFYYILPILAALPFADSYYADLKSGYVKNIFTRAPKVHYYTAKGLAVFLSGAAAIFIPLMFNLYVTAMLLPSGMVDATDPTLWRASSMWGGILFANPYLYFWLYSLLVSAVAGLLALTALTVTRLVPHGFLALVTPFILYFFLTSVFGTMGLRHWIPLDFLRPSQGLYTFPAVFIVYAAALLLPAAILYFGKGLRDDTF